ncbi:hypothetical protein LINPERPRIM_LOCUS12843 [Linum perenne]
MRYSYRPEWV